MNVETPLPPPRSAISAAKLARREREVEFARGTVRHEGGILSDEFECLNARYLAGGLDSDALTVAILGSRVVQPR